MSTEIQNEAPIAAMNKDATLFQFFRIEAYYREPESLVFAESLSTLQIRPSIEFVLGAELACNGKFRAACTFNHLYRHMVKLALQEAAQTFFKHPYIQTAFWINLPKFSTDIILHSVSIEYPVASHPDVVNPDDVNFLPELNRQAQFILDCINNKELCDKIVSAFWILKDEIDKINHNDDLTEDERSARILALLPVDMNAYCKKMFFPNITLVSEDAYHILTSILATNTEVLFYGVPFLVRWPLHPAREVNNPRPD